MNEIIIYPKESSGKIADSPISIGLDLGTTYALMAVVDRNNVDLNESFRIPVQFISFEQNSPFPRDPTIQDEKVATIVAIYDNKPYVGNNLYHLKGLPDFKYKKNIFYHWKVEMGIDHHPLYADAGNPKLDMPYKIAGAIMNFMRLNYIQGGPHELPNTIITVPASFQANQRKDTIKAAELAKIKILENMLLDEPNAAFIGYFNRMNDEQKIQWAKEVRNRNVLVVDFGGGTLDLSLLNVDFRKDTGIAISNKAISRYNDLGGQDLDMLIAEEFLLPKLEKFIGDPDALDITEIQDVLLPQLSVIAEDLKKEISDLINLKAGAGDIAEVDLENIHYTRFHNKISYNNGVYDLGDIKINGDEFKTYFTKIFSPKQYKFKYLDKTVTTVSTSISEIISKANETLDNVHYVLFVGGSSFNPLLGMMTGQKLVNARILTSSDPDKLVAEGAAVYSYFLNQHGVSLISPIVSDDLGVLLKGDRFYPILEAGKRLPQDVEIPEFRLQSNLISEIVVPVCLGSAEFPIGEIRCPLTRPYPIDTVITIKAKITIDKVFYLEIYAEDELLGGAVFENPFGVGKLSEKELEVHQARVKLNQAKKKRSKREEQSALKDLIMKYLDSDDHLGGLEQVETYIRKFDDQSDWAWNAKYMFNQRLGRNRAAETSLIKAIELDPIEPAYRHNYALQLTKEDPREALNYLEKLPEDISYDSSIRCFIAELKHRLDGDSGPAIAIVEEFKQHPGRFDNFDRRGRLFNLHRIAGEPYSYTDPKNLQKEGDKGKYLEGDDLPIQI